jgi:nickel-type superoxide dismutase maturation protease
VLQSLLVLDHKLHKEDRSVQVQLSLVGTTSLVSLLQERYFSAFFAKIPKQLCARLLFVSRFGTVRVSGHSMAPTFNDGDWLLVWYSPHIRIQVGQLIVLRRPLNSGAEVASLFIKRIAGISGAFVTVHGDNKDASTDSRQWGDVAREEIIGKVIGRYHKGKRA